jgi:hypothetical protein
VKDPIYIEHYNPIWPSKVRRYQDLDEACAAVAVATRVPLDEIREELGYGGRPSFRYGVDTWVVVTPHDFAVRYGRYSNVYLAMFAGEDVEAMMDDVDALGDA